MQALLAEQKERIKNFDAFQTNYGKANKTEKAKLKFHERRLEKLNKWWLEFDKANTDLIAYDDDSDEYFEEKLFENYSEKYKDLRTQIQNAVVKLKEKSQTKSNEMAASSTAKENSKNDQSPANKSQIEDVLSVNDDEDGSNSDNESVVSNESNAPAEVKVLYHLVNEIRAAFEMADDVDLKTSSGLASAQLENVKALWSDLRATHRTILLSNASAHCNDIDMNRIQAKFLKTCGKLNEYARNGSEKSSANLPKLTLPEFDGTTSWRAFRELFDEIVHTNRSLSDRAKAQYLKTSLKGLAAGVVSGLGAHEDNYQSIYNALVKRYENKRKMVTDLLDNLLDIPKQNTESSSALRHLHDVANECVAAISNLQVDTTNWDPLIVHILMKKLSRNTVLDYESKLKDVRELQNLTEFLQYIENRFMALLSTEKAEKSSEKVYVKPKEKAIKDVSFNCTYCEKPHSIYKCTEFVKLEPKERSEWVKKEKHCFVCLLKHDPGQQCKSKFQSCKKCMKKHNTLLHFESKNDKQISLVATATAVNGETATSSAMNEPKTNTLITTKDEQNLLATAMIKVSAKNGQKIMLKAVVDPGSQSSLITESALQLLALPAEKISAEVDGLSAVENKIKKRVEMKISPRFSSDFNLDLKALVLKKITNLATFKGDLKDYDYLQNLLYADPTENDDKSIDILLGVAAWSKIVKNGIIKGPENAPIAMNTELGWLIMGANENNTTTIKVTSLISNTELENKIEKFFFSEDINDDTDDENTMNDEESYCEEFYTKTTKRGEDGRLIVSMPFKNREQPQLGESKKTALATLFQLEKRFEKNKELKKMYSESIHDAIEQGHMVLVENPPPNAHYIPHHAVFKDSTTTKLRTVYNASQKTSNGLSLNEQCASGKIVQPTIIAIMLRWRLFKVAMIADIEKMYKQIWLDENQQHLQMILWRDNTDEKIKHYKLTTVTFGVTISPYLAIRSLKEIARIVAEEAPNTAKAILECFYVDDYNGGADSVEKAIELYDELKRVFNSFGFNLRKFVSNSAEFLNHLPVEDRELQTTSVTKTLGIVWHPENDEFTFKFKLNIETKPSTKRKLLSEIATLYDPMGWVAPVIVKAKILMQAVWALRKTDKKNYEWDDILPQTIIEEWMEIKSHLEKLQCVRLPRWVKIATTVSTQLHGFCDASEKAIAACIYIRTIDESGSISSLLLIAKTKNATMESTPKLELMGAVLLTKLMKSVRKELKINIEKTFLWCDSRVALSWIASNPRRYKKFVSSRITQIQKLKNVVWLHIPGVINPADCASRGMYGNELEKFDLWWNGPQLLCEETIFEKYALNEMNTNNEMKVNTLIAIENECILPQVSSLQKLQRVMAYVRRFIDYTRNKCKKNNDPISVSEIRIATKVIVKIVQNMHFSEEIVELANEKSIKKSSPLRNLGIFLDENGILRVGGRLDNAALSFDRKHQILIPHNSELATLIIRNSHKICMHGGPKITEAHIRQRFWIVKSQTSIKKELRRCVTCSKQKPIVMTQFMANLPAMRVNKSEKPFLKCSVDFAGPVQVKTSKLRNAKIVKGYIAVFTCMAIKAVHIEPVSDLTAESFVAALRRFLARRSYVSDMYSDNGTNFVRTEKILIELTEAEKEQFAKTVNEEAVRHDIVWHFAPPASPHFNGLVEAAVKTLKYHIVRETNNSALTLDEWMTLLCQIEAIANSRPLCGMSDDPNDTTILTPAHFLNHVPMEMAPYENLSECKMSYLSRWQMVQRLVQKFWKRWENEYLHQLQVRAKWTTKKPDVEVGDIVTLKDENLPPGKWHLARVTKKHVGADGLTRVVSVKTANNTLKRAIAKIAPLPIHARDGNPAEKPKTNTKRSAVMPVLTTLLSLFMTTPSVNAEITKNDLIKAAIDGAVKIYDSDTTKNWLNSQSPTRYNSNEINTKTLFTSSVQKIPSLEFKWWIIGVIFVMCCVGFLIATCYILCAGMKKRSKIPYQNRPVTQYNTNNEQKRQPQQFTIPIDTEIDRIIMQNYMRQFEMREQRLRAVMHNEQGAREEIISMSQRVEQEVQLSPVPLPRRMVQPSREFVNVLAINDSP